MMTDVLSFALQSVWHFLGTVSLIWVSTVSVAIILRAVRGR